MKKQLRILGIVVATGLTVLLMPTPSTSQMLYRDNCCKATNCMTESCPIFGDTCVATNDLAINVCRYCKTRFCNIPEDAETKDCTGKLVKAKTDCQCTRTQCTGSCPPSNPPDCP